MGLRTNVAADRAAMGQAAAAHAAETLREVLRDQPGGRVVFAAAASQVEFLDSLAVSADIAWDRVTAFHLDEYVGLPPDAPQRFANWLDRHLFRRLPFASVHRLMPDPDPDAAARAYAGLLAAAPLDLGCLGIGVNGHLAFNDPPVADFADPLMVKPVLLDAVCRQQQVDDGAFATLDQVPRAALTLTIPCIMAARRLVVVVPGPAKRAAVSAALHGPINTACPASILRTHPDCALFLDGDSAP